MPRNASNLIFALFLSLLTATSPLMAQTASDLSITMSDAPDPVLDGGQVTYTIVVTNGGPDDVQGLELLDSASWCSPRCSPRWACGLCDGARNGASGQGFSVGAHR